MNAQHFYSVSAFFNGLCSLFLVYYVYLRNPKNPINQSFLYFGISVAGWSLIYSLWSWAQDALAAEFYVRRQMMFESFIPATFFHFSICYVNKSDRFHWLLRIFYGLSAISAFGMLSPALITGVRKILFFEYWPIAGKWLPAHVLYFFGAVSCSFVVLFLDFFKNHGRRRAQTAWVLLAFAVGFGGGSVNWFLWFDIMIPPTTNFFVGMMFVIMAYAIVRYGVMDVDVLLEVSRASRASAMGLVASSLNHELRNPLFIARSQAETYLDQVDRGIYKNAGEEILKSRAAVRSIHEQLTRTLDIIKKFSDFARPQPVNALKEKVDLRKVIEDMISMASNDPAWLGIGRVDVAVNGECVMANRRQIEEIFFNLMINAAHAMEGKSGELSIHAQESNGQVLVEVADTGSGIPREHLGRIFEPFYTTKEDRGTGLGLYITKQLVERNGGRMLVQSAVGRGTKFILEFQR